MVASFAIFGTESDNILTFASNRVIGQWHEHL